MGIPVWKPKKSQHEQQISLHSTIPHQQHSITHHHGTQYRLHRRRRLPTLLAEPYYIAADGYTPTSIASLPPPPQQQQPIDNSNPRSQRPSPSRITTLTTTQQVEIENQIQQRFNEKQELLDQLKITISLLDQFLSIREISGQQLPLPPLITGDLLSILTATAITSPSMNDINHHDNNVLPRPSPLSPPTTTTITTTTARTRMPLRSYGHPANDTSLTRLVERMIESPPHASRWAELESDIASTHRRVCEQLNRLGTSLTTTSLPSPTPLTTSQSIHSFSSSFPQ